MFVGAMAGRLLNMAEMLLIYGDRGALMLTRIDAKMGVLMIHQDISVLSIMSQHLWRKKHKVITKIQTTPRAVIQQPCGWFPTPHRSSMP